VNWFEQLRTEIPDHVVEIVDHVWDRRDFFVRWPQRALFFSPGCIRIDYHRYTPDQLSQLRTARIRTDTRSNGPAIMAFLLAGGERPRRNIIEIGKTPDRELREQLRGMAKRLAKDYHPLELTNHLVQQLCRAYENGLTTVSWSIDQEREQFWAALSEPYAIGESERQELTEWADRLETSQRESNDEFRNEVDRIFANSPESRPDTPGKLARLYMKNRMLLYEVTTRIYKRSTGRVLPLSRLEVFLEAKPRIRALYLAAQAYSIFYNCVWTEGRRWAERHHRQNAVGLLDLWAAVYLAACDYFVTNDTRDVASTTLCVG